MTAPSVTVCLQSAGVLCQKSGINSEEKRWQAIRRASHLRVRRSRASVLNPPPLAGVSWTLHKVGPKFGRVSLPYPPAVHRVSADPPPSVTSNSPTSSVSNIQFFCFCVFSRPKFDRKFGRSKNYFFDQICCFGDLPEPVFSQKSSIWGSISVQNTTKKRKR